MEDSRKRWTPSKGGCHLLIQEREVEMGRFSGRKEKKRLISGLLCCLIAVQMVLPAAAWPGKPVIPGLFSSYSAPAPRSLPVLRGRVEDQVGITGIDRDSDNGRMVVHQGQKRAVADWESFDVGEKAWVHFDQKKNRDWAVLNRIHDGDPSRIFGQISADGKVVLLNQNGILFGPSARVNLHGLAASALSMAEEDFNQGIMKFSGAANPDAVVSNHGIIETDFAGEVILAAPNVENNGLIITPGGKIILAAGSEAERGYTGGGDLLITVNPDNTGQDSGVAHNLREGSLVADYGTVGIFGRVVNQDGMVRAVTAYRKGGKVILSAKERVSTGKGSVISSPVSASQERVHKSFPFNGGIIEIGSSPTADDPVELIEHRGTIYAPSGEVSMKASQRVYLDEGSVVDVSGLNVKRPVSEQMVRAQMNSVQLRDDQLQKGGVLQGEYITTLKPWGSSIGDISGHLAAEEQTAMEAATSGGQIRLESGEEIVAKKGSVLDFSGGSINYGSGNVSVTHLLAGDRIFQITDAPEWLKYEAILDRFEKVYERYGQADEYKGLFYGSPVPLLNYVGQLRFGKDAGQLSFSAPVVVANGEMVGSVVKGVLQTRSSDPTDEYDRVVATGYQEPVAGSVVVGHFPDEDREISDKNHITKSIRIAKGGLPLDKQFGADDPLAGDESFIDSDQLSAGKLKMVKLAANLTISVDDDAEIGLVPGGKLKFLARAIDVNGSMDVPGGDVDLTIWDNISSTDDYPGGRVELPAERIFLGEKASISVRGERVDLSQLALAREIILDTPHISGGTISLKDETQSGDGVILKRGSTLDVEGGYRIDSDGKVKAGDGGSIAIQGQAVVLDGDVRGLAFLGGKGGSISVHAGLIGRRNGEETLLSSDFRFDSGLPDNLKDYFLLAPERLTENGFTSISLKSRGGITLQDGFFIEPSSKRLALPFPGQENGGTTISIPAFMADGSSISLQAGKKFTVAAGSRNEQMGEGVIEMESGSGISVHPGGTISLEGIRVEMDGSLSAPSGEISLTGQYGVEIGENGRIAARGYNRPAPDEQVSPLLPLPYRPQDGGRVSISSDLGPVTVERGSLIDVSGSQPVGLARMQADGSYNMESIASAPGSIEITYYSDLQLLGRLAGQPTLGGIKGGEISLFRNNSYKSSAGTGLLLTQAMADLVMAGGFDAVTLKSRSSIDFSGGFSLAAARRLELDARAIQAVSGNQQEIQLNSSWVQLKNSFYPEGTAPAAGSASIVVNADYIDVDGDINLSGFQDVTLSALQDLRLFDRQYSASAVGGSGGWAWSGRVAAAGDMTLQAGRIYAGTLSRFTVDAAGTLKILSSGHDVDGSTILSAGSDLILRGDSIIDQGFLAAPMGRLTLEATGEEGRVFVAQEASLYLGGELPIDYGSSDEIIWTITDKDDPHNIDGIEVQGAPKSSLLFRTGENGAVVVMPGAELDISGGGSIFSSYFLPGIEGSMNPIEREKRYVVHPDIHLPGYGIYVGRGAGLEAGTYSVLPSWCAFLPGAFVLEDIGAVGIDGQQIIAPGGYPVVAGRGIEAGKVSGGVDERLFSVRTASDLLREGSFLTRRFSADDGAGLQLDSGTVIFQGVGSDKGSVSGPFAIAAKALEINARAADLNLAGLGPYSPIPDELKNRATISSELFSRSGFSRITLGDETVTESITVGTGAEVTADVLELSASEQILIQNGAVLEALQGEGSIRFNSAQGQVTVEEGGVVHAAHEIVVNAPHLDNRGEMRADNSGLTISGTSLFFAPEGYSSSIAGATYLSGLDGYLGFEELTFRFSDSINFVGNQDLSVASELILDSPAINGLDGAEVSLRAETIRLANSFGEGAAGSAGFPLQDQQALNLTAGRITVGPGSVAVDGFGQIAISAGDTLTFTGRGQLLLDGDLHVTAGQITTAGVTDADSQYQNARFTVDAGGHTIAFNPSGSTPAEPFNGDPGGSLTLTASEIVHRGLIKIPAGMVTMNGRDVRLEQGIIDITGTDHFPGGVVSLKADSGTVEISSGSVVDVSAGAQGDAGTIEIYSPENEAVLDGALLGARRGDGLGGSLLLDSGGVSGLGDLAVTLASGGIEQEISIRARQGDITLDSGDLIRASLLNLSADDGSIILAGQVDLSGEDGGKGRFYAGHDLRVQGTAQIDASGDAQAGKGGRVLLSSAQGEVITEHGSTIDLSGSERGVLHLRGARTVAPGNNEDSDVAIRLNGTIIGAEEVLVEAFKSYDLASSYIGFGQINMVRTDASSFMGHQAEIESRLLSSLDLQDCGDNPLKLLPGIEMVNRGGDLRLGSTLDLTTWRYNGNPGFFTLRAAGNLSITSDLVDHPTTMAMLLPAPAMDSWGINLIAGADLDAADLMATIPGAGSIEVSGGRLVYTESAPLRFSAGGDLLLHSGKSASYMINSYISYSMGTYDQFIDGRILGDISIDGGAIQSATGDISLFAGNDVIIQRNGAVRTTGFMPVNSNFNFFSQLYPNYSRGGAIELVARGDVMAGLGFRPGTLADQAWDQKSFVRIVGELTDPMTADAFSYRGWSASYGMGGPATSGVATMAGGDIRIVSGNEFMGQAGSFSLTAESDLMLFAPGNLDGRFVLGNGHGLLATAGSFGKGMEELPLEVFDSTFEIHAWKDLNVGAVLNPPAVNWKVGGDGWLGYSADSGVVLDAINGDVTLTASSYIHDYWTFGAGLMPPSLEITAAGDILLKEGIYLTPSPTGRLVMTAGRNIVAVSESGAGISVKMSDADLDSYLNRFDLLRGWQKELKDDHADIPIHMDDPDPVILRAGGDITQLRLTTPKQTRVIAGGEISNLSLNAQNLREEDITIVKAGSDIWMKTQKSYAPRKLECGGPGTFIVQAGNNLDLGTSLGIQSVGNVINPVLGEKGADLLVIVGTDREIQPSEVYEFFDQLRDAGNIYSRLLGEDKGQALSVVQKAREEVIEPFFASGDTGQGRIDMIRSQISTVGKDSDLSVVATGPLNIGRSSLSSNEDKSVDITTGISTELGGDINIFSYSDVNVLESRVMTKFGGDITVWSDYGNINAGRGSKTAINAGKPIRVWKEDHWEVQIKPAAVGSGIRTLTYDPDGFEGPLQPPPPGDAYLFAPQGVIDAGEAGISAGNVILGATKVLNSQNITFSVGSVGVPVNSVATSSVGALAGSGTVAAASSLADSVAQSAASRNLANQAKSLASMNDWLDVKVIAFD